MVNNFVVLVQQNGATVAPAIDVTAHEAWDTARRYRDAGHRVWIMSVNADGPACVVHDDEPLD